MEKKKALMLASVASMIDQFNMPNINLLQSLGYHVDVVADYTNPGNISNERSEELQKRLREMGAEPIDIPIPRSINYFTIQKAYKLVKDLVTTEHYDLIHCHSPIGGAIARMAAKGERKNGTKVIYTAHGFHFYKGAPVKNWIVYFPIELALSKYTDILITINNEDYKRACNRLRAKEIDYVPGIGVDIKKYRKHYEQDFARQMIGIDRSDIVILSVGELNENKNHEIVIKSLALLKKDNELPSNLRYIVVGQGKKEERLKGLIHQLKLDEQIKLVGFREDTSNFYDSADAYVLPSKREGLNVSLMEAMAKGLPVICSSIRGNVDLIEDGKNGMLFDYNDAEKLANCIKRIINSNSKYYEENNIKKIKQYDINNISILMKKIYVRAVSL